MVCIIDWCGVICVSFTYLTLMIANVSFINIVIVPEVHRDNTLDIWIILAFYEAVIILIVWSHLKTMCAEPGYIPKGYSKYKKQCLPVKYQQA